MSSRIRCWQRLAAAGLTAALLLGGAAPALESAFPAGGFTPPPDTPVIPWLRFSIQYAVRILGNDGPSSIFFYVTTDGGLTWRLLGEDPDKKSPMLVTVPSEGTYGFATVVASGVSLAINAGYTYWRRQPGAIRPRQMKLPGRKFSLDYGKRVLPVVLNEGLWCLGMTMYAVFYGRLGDDAVNAVPLFMVDFSADWCGPCKMLGPVIERLASDYDGKVLVGKVNVDDEPELAQRFNVMSIPTVVFLKNGAEFDRKIGVMPQDAFTAVLDANL